MDDAPAQPENETTPGTAPVPKKRRNRRATTQEARDTSTDWRKEQVAVLLAEGKTQEEAAAATGCSRSTITRWAREPAFKERVSHLRARFNEVRIEARVDVLRATHDELQDGSVQAARTLAELTKPTAPQPEPEEGWAKVPHSVRVAACKALLESAQRLRQERLVEERLARLEALLGLQQGAQALPPEEPGEVQP